MAPGAYTQGIILSTVTSLLPGTAWNGMLGLATSKELTQAKHIGGGILYVLFALSSLVAPAIVNTFGPRLSLFLSGSTYVVFCFSMLLAAGYSAIPVWVVTVTMSIVGLGAGVLWTAQGMMTLTYPTQKEKGRYQTTFWVILNLSATVLGIYTWLTNKDGPGTLSTATWWTLCVMAVVGLGLIAFLAPLQDVVRSDGTMCEAPEPKSIREEIHGMRKVMMDKRVMALFPLFLYSNWFYAYELTSFSGTVFDAGASGLASAIFWGSQMIGAKCLDVILVHGQMAARKRAFISITMCFVLIAISWVWGLWANSHYNADAAARDEDFPRVSWNDAEAPMAFALMGVWGFCDALVQNWVYWIVTQLYKNPADMGRMVGVFKAVQSLASSVSFFIGSALLPSGQLWLIIAIFLSSIPGAYMLCASIKSESVEDIEKLVTTDP